MSKRKAVGALDRWVKPRVPVQPKDDWLAGLESGPDDIVEWPKGIAEAHRTDELKDALHGFIVPVVSKAQYVAAKKRATDLSLKFKDTFELHPFDWECDHRSCRVLVLCKHCREDAGSSWGGASDEARDKVVTEGSYAWEVQSEKGAHTHITEYLNSHGKAPSHKGVLAVLSSAQPKIGNEEVQARCREDAEKRRTDGVVG
jgi:hypothetical protein